MQTTLDFEFIQRNKDTYLTIFKELDINIKDILFTKLNNFDYKVEVIKNDNFKHEIKIPLFFESKGTIKLIDIITIILKEMHNNSIFIIDELDSSLHTKLLEYIIKIFVSNKKNNSSQLIYTSHDMGTLTNKLFRKDEIYFAAINESYFSNIVSLADFDLQIRKTNSFSKLYMEGKLGYDPYIDYSLEWINGKKK